jgi:hypothetical protein
LHITGSPLIDSEPILTTTVPKKTKKKPAIDTVPASISNPTEPAVRPARKGGAAPKSPSRKVAAKKKIAASEAKKVARKGSKIVQPSDADIRLRAYFIAEHRLQLALPGDSANDWLEAKRQLIEEALQNQS